MATLVGVLAAGVAAVVVAVIVIWAGFDGIDLGLDGGPPECPDSDQAILRAAHAGDLDEVSRRIEQGEVGARDADGRTALYCAARGGQVEVAARLLAAGADPDVANAAGDTPLLWAAQQGDLDMIEALVAGGADVDRTTDAGHTPLLRAVYGGDLAVVQRLLAVGADPNLGGGVSSFEMSMLVLQVESGAPLSGSQATGTRPRSHGTGPPPADQPPVSFPTGTGTPADNITPLHVASAFARADLVGELLRAGADPDATALGGFTPLHVAAIIDGGEVASLLLEGGADPTPSTGQPEPAALARALGHRALAESIDASASPAAQTPG